MDEITVTETGGAESVSQIQAEARRHNHELEAAYHQLTQHGFGRVILKDLEKNYPTDQNVFSRSEKYDTHAAALRDGQRTPVIYIKKMIESYERRTRERASANPGA